MERCRVLVMFVVMVSARWGYAMDVEPINVPNGSFESPETEFVDVRVDSWEEAAKPWWYDESSGNYWTQLTGVFLNLPPDDPESIDNCDGEQAAWLFALPEVELSQDLEATFDVGMFYRLTVGVIGGGANMKDNVPLDICLYYRDEEGNKVTIGSTTFTYRAEMGHVKHLNDVLLEIPRVREEDMWAGKNIGVQILSGLVFPDDFDPETGRSGGFWDLDHVRLVKSAVGPDLSGDGVVNLEDLAVIGQEWMMCGDVMSDLTGEGCVDMEDMVIVADFWLQECV